MSAREFELGRVQNSFKLGWPRGNTTPHRQSHSFSRPRSLRFEFSNILPSCFFLRSLDRPYATIAAVTLPLTLTEILSMKLASKFHRVLIIVHHPSDASCFRLCSYMRWHSDGHVHPGVLNRGGGERSYLTFTMHCSKLSQNPEIQKKPTKEKEKHSHRKKGNKTEDQYDKSALPPGPGVRA